MELGLIDRACVVSGGSRGIGLATAARLRAEGANVLLLGRDQDSLVSAADSCGGAEWLSIDLTAPDAGERVVRACRERFGRLDVLVNNAGTSSTRAIDELTDEEWQSQWDIHVMAPMRLMRAAIPVMARAGWGRLVNAVTPGPVATELWLGPDGLAEQTARASDQSRDQVLQATAASVPLGRLGEPDEIAAVIVFLCSEAAANVTGAAWSVDGGAVPVII